MQTLSDWINPSHWLCLSSSCSHLTDHISISHLLSPPAVSFGFMYTKFYRCPRSRAWRQTAQMLLCILFVYKRQFLIIASTLSDKISLQPKLQRSLRKVKLRSLLIWIYRRVFRREYYIFFHFIPPSHHQRWIILKVLGQRSSKKRRHPGVPCQEALQVGSSAAGVPFALLSDPSKFFFLSLSASSADVRLSSEGRLRTARPGVSAGAGSAFWKESWGAESWRLEYLSLCFYWFALFVSRVCALDAIQQCFTAADFDWYSTTPSVKMPLCSRFMRKNGFSPTSWHFQANSPFPINAHSFQVPPSFSSCVKVPRSYYVYCFQLIF